MGKNKKKMQTGHIVKKQERAAGWNTAGRNSGGQEEISQVLQFPCSSAFLAFYALLFF